MWVPYKGPGDFKEKKLEETLKYNCFIIFGEIGRIFLEKMSIPFLIKVSPWFNKKIIDPLLQILFRSLFFSFD